VTPQDPAMLVQFFKALAHESRLRLLGLVAAREHSVQELAQLIGLKEPTVSHHLAMLREAGLVRLRQDKNTHWYALEQKTLSQLSRAMLAREQLATLASPQTQTAGDDRAVRNYLTPEGRIKAFPATLKKRRPILAWLTRHFEEDRRYSEAEVNEIIERRHHDRETFRRELVAYRMLARKSGIYWRLPESGWVA
jgi:biotin operon repressor